MRWDAAGNATQLDGLGEYGSNTRGRADAGIVGGNVDKFDGTTPRGPRAVRWLPGSTTAIEMEIVGTDASGFTNSNAYGMNESGTLVGRVHKYDAARVFKGERAIRWGATGEAEELGLLGTNPSGFANSVAHDIDDAGAAVGWAGKYDAAGNALGGKAVYWGTDGAALDLNTLIDPASGWTLLDARGPATPADGSRAAASSTPTAPVGRTSPGAMAE